MKNRLTAMTLAIILFMAVLMSLSCKDVPQNTSNTTANNTAMNSYQKSSDQNSESVSTLDEDCSGADIEARQKKVTQKIKKNIEDTPILKYEYDDGKFDFDVVDESGKLVVYFWGRVYTEPEDKVDALNKTFKKLVKRGCVSKIVFGEPSNGKAALRGGFEYKLCEYPNGVCSDGTCKEGC